MSSSVNVGESSDKSTCPFCGIDGLTWLECHLTGGTLPCSQAPSTVKQDFQFGEEKLDEQKASNTTCCYKIQPPKLSTTPVSGILRKRLKMESVGNGDEDDSWLIDAKKSICSFLNENGIDFDVVKSPSFRKMASFFFGPKVEIPASDKLQGWMLENEFKEMGKYVNEVRSSWAGTGSSILIDGWANAEGRNFISVFVDSPKGTIYLSSFDVSGFHGNSEAMKLLFEQVIEEVGRNNVVQIITYSTSTFFKEIGKQLMEKYRSIFWTVDTSICIDLMIEKYGAIVSETLEKAKIITRFVYNHHQVLKFVQDHAEGGELVVRSKTKLALSFFTLENIVSKEKLLKAMFLSSGSQSGILTSTPEGKKVADLVGNKSFWANARTVLTAAMPLVNVMELINEKRSHMDCIYETMDQVKETIKEGFGKKKSQHMHFWNVIDEVWCGHLYSPLHSAGYFLNPTIFYSEDVCVDKEVSVGLLHCVSRMARDLTVVDLITDQLEQYEKPKGGFAVGCAVDNRSNISPVEWWSKYGGGCPELQKFAIRILSQTCNGASRLQLERGLVENLFKRRRNQTEQERLREMVSMNYNMHLSKYASGANNCIESDEIHPVCDWTVDKEKEACGQMLPEIENGGH